MLDPDEPVLLDTSVLLHLFRGKDLGHRIEADYELATRAQTPLISVVTIGEILALARRNAYGKEKRERLAKLIGRMITVDVEYDIAMRFAEVLAGQQAIGRPIGENDTWIAATAMQNDATLLTTDRDDFGKLVTGLIKVEVIKEAKP